MSPSSPTLSPHGPLSYLPHVDGLRALAVALVVVFHAWPAVLPGGFIGVDVFFVISGFIITRQIALEMEQGSFSYLAFLGRRARRLIPAAFVCCLFVTAAATVVLMPDALTEFGRSLVAVWTMTANIFFYAESGYFDAPSAEAPLLHMWSLAVEDQFYLTWPLLLLVLLRWISSQPRVIVAVIALGALSLAHAETMAYRDPDFAFYLPFSRAFELLAGCALALGHRHLAAPGAGVRAALDLVGLAMVLGSAVLLSAATPFPGLAAVPAVAGSVLMIGAGLSGPTLVSRLLSAAPVVLTGKMSYSIYLYHWPPLALATYWLGRAPDATEAAALVALALVLAALSWLLVEQALTRRLGLYDRPASSLLKGTLALSTAFCAVGLVTLAARGWPQRLDEPAERVYEAASKGNPLRKFCDGYDVAFSRTGACTFGAPLDEDGYQIAVFGDSNADHFVPMIADLAAKAQLSGRQITQSACAALIGIAIAGRTARKEAECAAYQRTILEFLDRNPKLKIAVLSAAWGDYTDAVANAAISSGEAAPPRPFAAFAADTVRLLRDRGIKVLIIGQVPHFDTFSLGCLAQAARTDTEQVACTVARDVVDRELDASQQAFAAIAAADAGVVFLDMVKLLCTRERCSAFKDDVLIYRDSSHINALGAHHLARYATLPAFGP